MIDPAIQTFVSIFREAGVHGASCDESQICDLEQQLRIELPPAYKAFLLIAGQGFRPFEGSHYAIEDDMAELQRAGRRILRKDGNDLPSDAFVFLVHQGFALRFFLLNDGDDPAVFEYVGSWPPAKQLWPRFSEFLLRESGGTSE